MATRIHDSADVDDRAQLGEGTVVWHLAQVRENAQIGRGCIVGRGAYVGVGVVIGDEVKIQNYALVYEPATIGDGAFIGPAVVLTNDRHPRSIDPDGSKKSADGWDAAGVAVEPGASVGARAVVIGGVTLGEWSMVAAGAVVTRDVPPFALVAGVPARFMGWVGRAGRRLEDVGDGSLICPTTGQRYRSSPTGLAEVSA
jgi:UDP-2-acetamido-3-amino-2,3-dideoxy-glucuronate N-acetyltransferase